MFELYPILELVFKWNFTSTSTNKKSFYSFKPFLLDNMITNNIEDSIFTANQICEFVSSVSRFKTIEIFQKIFFLPSRYFEPTHTTHNSHFFKIKRKVVSLVCITF